MIAFLGCSTLGSIAPRARQSFPALLLSATTFCAPSRSRLCLSSHPGESPDIGAPGRAWLSTVPLTSGLSPVASCASWRPCRLRITSPIRRIVSAWAGGCSMRHGSDDSMLARCRAWHFALGASAIRTAGRAARAAPSVTLSGVDLGAIATRLLAPAESSTAIIRHQCVRRQDDLAACLATEKAKRLISRRARFARPRSRFLRSGSPSRSACSGWRGFASARRRSTPRGGPPGAARVVFASDHHLSSERCTRIWHELFRLARFTEVCSAGLAEASYHIRRCASALAFRRSTSMGARMRCSRPMSATAAPSCATR